MRTKGLMIPRITKLVCMRGRGYTSLLTVLACVVTLQVLVVLNQQCADYNPEALSVSRRSIKGFLAETLLSEKTSGCKDATQDKTKYLMFPSPKREKGFLTIGIPTIQRKGVMYVTKTISSLVSSMSSEEKKEVLIVVFLADTDPQIKQTLARQIQSNFTDLIDQGSLHIIEAPPDYYPPMTITKYTYGQSQNYIEWRAKQNFDYSFMMDYSFNLTTYYMQLEDDVITLTGFISAIKQYIAEQKDAWTCLEFSELGFIGKLYKTTDVPKLSAMLRLFYEEQPVDYTYLYFNMMNTQMVQRLRKPTLFQHQGIHSSFPGKIQPLKDKFFDNMTKIYKGDNPAAEVFTSMKIYSTFLPRLAYEKTEGYFWTHGSPTDGDSFTIVFQIPHILKRVVVDTGSKGHPEDKLLNGQLEVSLTLLKTEENIQCINDIVIGEFVDGRIDVSDLDTKVKFQVMCMRVKVTQHQTPWLIIREIAVFIA